LQVTLLLVYISIVLWRCIYVSYNLKAMTGGIIGFGSSVIK